MRILQLIDSLDIGGAEKMAVLYANELAAVVENSYLVSTRKEGALRSTISKRVGYLFLNRKTTFDLTALRKLIRFCKEEKISHIQAHGTSVFFACLVKLMLPKIKLIFHDHFGSIEQRKIWKYKLSTFNVDLCIAVNEKIASWNNDKLNIPAFYLPNFSVISKHDNKRLEEPNGRIRIISVANFRVEKGHPFLFKIAKNLKDRGLQLTWNLYGRVSDMAYFQQLKQLQQDLDLDDCIFFHENKTDLGAAITDADIAVLTSSFEGLPLALIEYGLAAKAVVVTAVGACVTIVKANESGLLAPYEDVTDFADKVAFLCQNPDKRQIFGARLHETVSETFSAEAVINQFRLLLKSIK